MRFTAPPGRSDGSISGSAAPHGIGHEVVGEAAAVQAFSDRDRLVRNALGYSRLEPSRRNDIDWSREDLAQLAFETDRDPTTPTPSARSTRMSTSLDSVSSSRAMLPNTRTFVAPAVGQHR